MPFDSNKLRNGKKINKQTPKRAHIEIIHILFWIPSGNLFNFLPENVVVIIDFLLLFSSIHSRT